MLGNLTHLITEIVTNLYITTGLLGIILAMAIESCCIPLPSEVIMPLAGIMLSSGRILRGTDPLLGLVLVALAGAIGCLLGSIVAYSIGYAGGRPLMLRYGRYVLISQHDADKADAFFQRWGSPTAFFSRLLPVVRTYISLPAGIARMPFVRFCIYTFLGSFPWCLLLAYVGIVLGNHLDTLGPIFHSLDIVILAILVILFVLYIWRHIRNDRKARAAHAAAEVQASQITPPVWNEPVSPPTQQASMYGWEETDWGQPQQQPPQQGWEQQRRPQ